MSSLIASLNCTGCTAGFEQPKYNVNEAVTSQMVCLELTSGQLPDSADVQVSSTGDN